MYINLTLGLLHTEHVTNGDQWKVTDTCFGRDICELALLRTVNQVFMKGRNRQRNNIQAPNLTLNFRFVSLLYIRPSNFNSYFGFSVVFYVWNKEIMLHSEWVLRKFSGDM